jgi:membrane protease subunit HflK
MTQQNTPPPNMKITPPNLNLGAIKWFVVVFLIVVAGFKSFTTVDAEEVGVVLRLGKYHDEIPPGLNFIVPFVDDVYKVPVLRQLKQEFGFRTIESGVRSQYRTSGVDVREEALMLTGDLNAAQVEWIIQYSIKDAKNYLFKVRSVENTFRYINEAVMREIIGDRSVNEVITTGKEEIQRLAEERIQELCNAYETGIKVEQLILQDVNPPDPVKPAFNEVNEAEQQKNKLVNQAEAEYNKVIPKAKGQALQLIEEAKGYKSERVNRAKGEASRFTSLYNEYRKAREVTRQRIYLETMESVMNKVGKKLITDEKAQGILPLFNFEKGMK